MLRASDAPIWANCPGSPHVAALKTEKSPVALEGSLVHLLVHWISSGMAGVTHGDFNTPEFQEQNETGLIVTEEYLDMALAASQYALGLVDPSADHWETPLQGEHTRGVCDFYGYNSQTNTLHIVEFKFGFSPVAALWNWQLLTYLLMLQPFGNAEKIALHVYQPRDFSEPIKVWEINILDVPVALHALQFRAEAAATGTGDCQTGPHCNHCNSRVFCKAFHATAASTLETIRTAESQELPPAALAAEYAYLLRAKEIITAATKGFEDLITYQLEHGQPVPGWQIGSGRGSRVWTGSVESIKALGGMFGVALTTEKPISITAADKLPVAKSGALDSVLSWREGSKKLVPFDASAAQEKFK